MISRCWGVTRSWSLSDRVSAIGLLYSTWQYISAEALGSSAQYPTHYLGITRWIHLDSMDDEKTQPQLNALEPTRWTPLPRTLNPQVSGSNPEGRTNSLVRAFYFSKSRANWPSGSQKGSHAAHTRRVSHPDSRKPISTSCCFIALDTAGPVDQLVRLPDTPQGTALIAPSSAMLVYAGACLSLSGSAEDLVSDSSV